MALIYFRERSKIFAGFLRFFFGSTPIMVPFLGPPTAIFRITDTLILLSWISGGGLRVWTRSAICGQVGRHNLPIQFSVSVQLLLFSVSLWENLCQIIGWRSPSGVDALPCLGNPGSVTGVWYHWKIDISIVRYFHAYFVRNNHGKWSKA